MNLLDYAEESFNEVIDKAEKIIKSNRSIKIERKLQSHLHDAIGKDAQYEACVFTCLTMILENKSNKKIELDSFFRLCVSLGALRDDDAFILGGGYEKIASIIGYKAEFCYGHPLDITSFAKIKRLIDQGDLVMLRTQGHSEIINGYSILDSGEVIFYLVDPDSRGDTEMSSKDWKPRKIDSGQYVYSHRIGQRYGYYKYG